MLYDQLRESWAFKEIWQEGEEKGLEKGRQEGEIAALQKTVFRWSRNAFPNSCAWLRGWSL